MCMWHIQRTLGHGIRRRICINLSQLSLFAHLNLLVCLHAIWFLEWWSANTNRIEEWVERGEVRELLIIMYFFFWEECTRFICGYIFVNKIQFKYCDIFLAQGKSIALYCNFLKESF